MISTPLARLAICSVCFLCLSSKTLAQDFLPAGASAQAGSPANKGNFRAGASRIVITPAPDAALPMSGTAAGRQDSKAFTTISTSLAN